MVKKTPSTGNGLPLCHERLYTLRQIAKARDLPIKRCGYTWLRYAKQGVQAANGELIKLETFLMGTRYQTSKEAVFRFLMALERAREDA